MATADQDEAPQRARAPLWVLLLASGIGAIGYLGWWLQLRPAASDWGNVAEWVAGLATTGAFLFTGRQILETRRAQEEADRRFRETAAHLVRLSVRIGEAGQRVWFQCNARNGGPLAIGDVQLELIHLSSSDPMASGWHAEPVECGTLLPGEEADVRLDVPEDRNGAALSDLGVSLTFVDMWATKWQRIVDATGVTKEFTQTSKR